MTAKFYIYRNLHKPGHFSIKHRGVVGMHTTCILCPHADLKVSAAGNKRARATKQRNVHAFVVTDAISFCVDEHLLNNNNNKREITYNPHHHQTFVYKDTNEPVLSASNVLLRDGKMYQLFDK